MSLISIITPFRNAERFILETAESILGQTYQEWEWIVVNDHSMEKEAEILSTVSLDHRVTLIENEGEGIINALETGLKIANGHYITRMDADDVMPTNKLLHFVQAIESEKADIITGKVSYFSDSGLISPGYLTYEYWLNERVDKTDFYDQIYRECTLSSSNWLMRKKDLLDCGGFQGLNYPEDYDLLFRWYQKGLKLKGIDEVTHLWREHPDRTSRKSANYAQDRFFDLKINRFIELDHHDQPLVLNGTGRKGRLTAKILIDKGISFSWVSIEPEKFKGGLYGHKILGHEAICCDQSIQILNAAKIDTGVVEKLYADRNEISRIIML